MGKTIVFLLVPLVAGVIARLRYGSNTRAIIVACSVLFCPLICGAIWALVGGVFVSTHHFSGMWYLFLLPVALVLGLGCGILIPVAVFRRMDGNESAQNPKA